MRAHGACGAGMGCAPDRTPITCIVVVSVVIAVRVPALNVRKIEKYLVIVINIVADLLIAQPRLAIRGRAFLIKMPCHINKINIGIFIFELVHKVKVDVYVRRGCVVLAAPGPHYHVPVASHPVQVVSGSGCPGGPVGIAKVLGSRHLPVPEGHGVGGEAGAVIIARRIQGVGWTVG